MQQGNQHTSKCTVLPSSCTKSTRAPLGPQGNVQLSMQQSEVCPQNSPILPTKRLLQSLNTAATHGLTVCAAQLENGPGDYTSDRGSER
jgi:hypothetical protein